MKSAVFYGKHNIKIEDLKMPEISKDDVLIKVKACGVCGTDVHIYNGDKGAADVSVPKVLGHEFAGEIVDVGNNVSDFKKGDRVCVDPNKMCGDCYYCRNGLGHFCEKMIGYGTSHNGGFAQYCAVNKSQILKLDDSTSYEEGAMAEPVSCCLHGIDMCNIKSGSKVAVIGGGMIGLIMLQLAKLAGASTIVLIEPVKAKRDMASKLGASLCIDPTSQNVVQELEKNNINRLEAVIECAGLTKTMEMAIDIAGKKSVAMLFGLASPDDNISVNPMDIFRKEVDIKVSFINPYTFSRAVELINSKSIDVSFMQCKPLAIEQLVDALSDDELRKQGKLVINPEL